MASISGILSLRHLRAEPNQFILHYRAGRITRRGVGLSYWFYPLSAAIAQVPVEDCETTVMIRERTSDMQEVAVQCTIVYRVAEPEKAATRANFTISLHTGAWIEKPLERLAAFWAQRARDPVRARLVTLPVADAVRSGAESIRAALREALENDAEVKSMGLGVVGVSIDQISPPPDLAKALETPTRESIQQKADEAVFQRRALAVEKERAIKENELRTQVELAKREEELIHRKNANALEDVRGKATSELAATQAQAERAALIAEAFARDTRTKAAGDADARRLMGDAEASAEAARAAAVRELPPQILWALAAQRAADKLTSIDHLTITPDTIAQALGQSLGDAIRGKPA